MGGEGCSTAAVSTVNGRARAAAPRLLAIASSGGHFSELCLLRSAFAGYEIHYATTIRGMADKLDAASFHTVADCNRNQRWRSTLAIVQIFVLLLRLRPDVVVTTGALPGLFAIALAKRMGARTIWVDTVACVEEMSLAGTHARKYADMWVSQWPHVAATSGAAFHGALL